MVFYRKYRRTGNRYARRGRSGYSMYKLYKSRSSGAQARQIYGLNKKMKRIQRLTKPEINIAPLYQQALVSDDGGSEVNGVRIYGPYRLTNLAPEGSTPAASIALLQGRFARIQNITIKGVFTYDQPASEELNSVDLQRMVCYLRVVLVQTKMTRPSAMNNEDVFSRTQEGTNLPTGVTPGSLNSFSMVRAPLKIGLARIAKVLSDKTYMISDTKQAVNIKTKLRYVRNWYKAGSEDGAKGDVNMFVMLYNQTAATPLVDASRCRFNFVSKCVYTDA